MTHTIDAWKEDKERVDNPEALGLASSKCNY